jgi:hypothetical protein
MSFTRVLLRTDLLYTISVDRISDTRKNPDAKHRAAGEAEMARKVNIAAARMGPIAREETRAQGAGRPSAHLNETEPVAAA